MHIDYLVNELDRIRPSLDSLSPEDVVPHLNNSRDVNEVRGRASEALVRQWLSLCPDVRLDEDFPRTVDGLTLTATSSGILVQNGDQRVQCEYDFLIYFERGHAVPVVVEVKSGGLNGFGGKIDAHLEMARRIYGRRDVGLLVFYPFRGRTDAVHMQRTHPLVRGVDLGYRRWQMQNYVERLQRQQRL